MVAAEVCFFGVRFALQNLYVVKSALLRRQKPDLTYVVFLLFFAVCIFWKLIFSSEYSVLTYPDCAFQTYPWAQYIAAVLHQASFPFWDHYSDAGRSFIGETQTGAFYPLNLFMGLLPLNRNGLVPVSVIEGFVILHCFLGSLFMYCLSCYLGLSRFSALVSGIVFGYCGSIGLRASAQINLLCSSIWVPAIFLFCFKALCQEHWSRRILFANLGGLCLALSLLAGHHQPVIYTALGLVFVTALVLIIPSKSLGPHRILPYQHLLVALLLLFVFGGLYASLQLFPSLEYSPLAYRWVDSINPTLVSARVPYSVAGTHNAFPPDGIFMLIFPYIAGVENSPYFGILPLVFAFSAMNQVRTKEIVWIAFLMALLFFCLSLGEYSPLHGLFYSLVPGFNKGREASRNLLLTHFALSLLTGFGCEKFCSPIKKKERKGSWQIVGIFCVFALLINILVAAGYFYRTQVLYQATNYGVPFFACLLLTSSAAVLAMRMWSRTSEKLRVFKIAIVTILLFDFHFLLSPHMKLKRDFDRKANYEPKQYYPHDEVIAFLKSQQGDFRVDFRDGFTPGNMGQVYKLETINGYGATSLKQFFEFQNHHYPPGNVIGDLLNVRFIVSDKDLALPRVLSTPRGTVYENPGWLPRAWLVDNTVHKEGLDEVMLGVQGASFDPLSLAYVEDPSKRAAQTSGASSVKGNVTFKRDSPNQFSLGVSTEIPRFVVISQNWYPGWRAAINGVQRRIFRTNGALMGIYVDSGDSRIEFSYRPSHYSLGVGLTCVSFLCMGAAYLHSRKAARNRLLESTKPT